MGFIAPPIIVQQVPSHALRWKSNLPSLRAWPRAECSAETRIQPRERRVNLQGVLLQSQDLGAMLMKALGGQAGSSHLTPIIYRPIVTFTDSVSQARPRSGT